MYPIIDLHQDLLSYLDHAEFFNDRNQTGFDRLKANSVKITLVSAFPVPANEDFKDPKVKQLIERDLERYNEYCAEHPEFVIVRNAGDVEHVMGTEGLYGLVLHIEGLNAFDAPGDWEMLERWHSLGLRSIGPLWNLNNPFGGGTLDPQPGLTALGKELVAWCEKKSIILDMAHMNRRTFEDATKLVTRPLFVSHGNADALCSDPRNYTDEQLRAVGETGGVIGVFFSKKFIAKEDLVGMKEVEAHVYHIADVAGEDAVALGSDFGGILSGFPEGLSSLDGLQTFLERFETPLREKLAYRNAERILKSHLS